MASICDVTCLKGVNSATTEQNEAIGLNMYWTLTLTSLVFSLMWETTRDLHLELSWITPCDQQYYVIAIVKTTMLFAREKYKKTIYF